MNQEIFAQLNDILCQHCSELAHDIYHVYRVLSLALDIAAERRC